MMKCESSYRIELCHTQKNFEKRNVKILRKVVNRQTYGQTKHALDDPYVIYDTVP